MDGVWGHDCVDCVVSIIPTDPSHREGIRERIKTTAPTGMCHIRTGALLSPDKALVLCHIPEIHGGEGGSGKEWYFSHRSTKSLWLTQGEGPRLSNQNNNYHHPVVSTVVMKRGSSSRYTESDHSSRYSNNAVESAASEHVSAEHANCSVLLITSIAQLVIWQILEGLFTCLIPLKWPAGAWSAAVAWSVDKAKAIWIERLAVV